MTGTRSVTAMTRRSGQSFGHGGRRHLADRLHPAGHRAGVDAAAAACRGGRRRRRSPAPGASRWVPVTLTDRTTSNRLPSSAQPTPTTIASPASAKKAARQRVRGRRRPRRGPRPRRPPGRRRGRPAGRAPAVARPARPGRRRSARPGPALGRRRGAAGPPWSRPGGGPSLTAAPPARRRGRDLGQHQRAHPGDVARAHGQHQVTGRGERGDDLGHVGEVGRRSAPRRRAPRPRRAGRSPRARGPRGPRRRRAPRPRPPGRARRRTRRRRSGSGCTGGAGRRR